MSKKTTSSIYPLLIMGVAMFLFGSCEKDDDNGAIKQRLTLTTAEVTKIGQVTAESGGIITSDAGLAVTARGVCWNTTGDPSITDTKTTDGSGGGSFTSKLTGLAVGTTYYLRAYATSSEGTVYGSTISFETLGSTFTDSRDGNVYKMVTIGDQIWMAENLKTTQYSNGAAIALVNTNSTWDALTPTSKAYCWYNDDIANKATYGGLYTWAAAMNGAVSSTANPSGVQGACPTGWHLPSDAEWVQMENYLADNGYNYDGTKEEGVYKIAKSLASTSGWASSSSTGTVGNTDFPAYRNKTGFTALPGGYRYVYGSFYFVGIYGCWWSATDYPADAAWSRALGHDYAGVYRDLFSKEVGLSVRCVKDF